MNALRECGLEGAARLLERDIRALGERIRRTVRIMEMCGSHTMAIARFGVKSCLPPNVVLTSGPGCPVCVTGPGFIDAALALAERGAILVTFGDTIRVPGVPVQSRRGTRPGSGHPGVLFPRWRP